MYGEATATARQLVGIANGLQLMQTDTLDCPDTEGRIQPLRSLDPGQRRRAISEIDDAVQLGAGSGPGTGSMGEVARLLQSRTRGNALALGGDDQRSRERLA